MLMPPCHWCGCGACVDAEMEVREMKCPVVPSASDVPSLSRVETPKLLLKMPTISEVLIQPAWADGIAKGETCLFTFVAQNSVRQLVKIGNPPLKLLVSARSWDESWAALELLLRGDDVPWMVDAGPVGGSGKKRR